MQARILAQMVNGFYVRNIERTITIESTQRAHRGAHRGAHAEQQPL